VATEEVCKWGKTKGSGVHPQKRKAILKICAKFCQICRRILRIWQFVKRVHYSFAKYKQVRSSRSGCQKDATLSVHRSINLCKFFRL